MYIAIPLNVEAEALDVIVTNPRRVKSREIAVEDARLRKKGLVNWNNSPPIRGDYAGLRPPLMWDEFRIREKSYPPLYSPKGRDVLDCDHTDSIELRMLLTADFIAQYLTGQSLMADLPNSAIALCWPLGIASPVTR
jgi:hypothetical protein